MALSCSNIFGQCIIFPKQKRILVIPSTPVTVSALQILSVNNGIYVQPLSAFINLTIISASTL